jgi:hypothetical protein
MAQHGSKGHVVERNIGELGNILYFAVVAGEFALIPAGFVVQP